MTTVYPIGNANRMVYSLQTLSGIQNGQLFSAFFLLIVSSNLCICYGDKKCSRLTLWLFTQRMANLTQKPIGSTIVRVFVSLYIYFMCFLAIFLVQANVTAVCVI